MLDAWADEVSAVKPERRLAERIFNDPMQFLTDELGLVLDDHGIGWAVTGWAAAERLAPFATAVPSVQVYIDERALWGPLSQAMQEIPVREVDSGGRIEFRSADSHLLKLVARRNGIPLATAPRVFADLQALGGRGEDAAMHLREEVILSNLRPRRRSTTSADTSAWDKRCRKRLKKRIADELGDVETVYDSGTWSVSYWIPEVALPFGELRDALVAVEGRETGWPPWWVPTRVGIQPRSDTAGSSAGSATMPCATMDTRISGVRSPTSSCSCCAAIRRTASPGLPARCLTRCSRYGAWPSRCCTPRGWPDTWTPMTSSSLRGGTASGSGAENRETDRWDFEPGHVAHDDSIATFVTTSREEIDQNLPSVVRALVSSLFEVFGLVDPPGPLYATEIAAMLERGRGQTGG